MLPETIDDLARAIYPVLVSVASKRNGTISYQALSEHLNPTWPDLEPRHPLLFHALGRIVEACRNEDLPALSCLVVHTSGDRMPGDGYFNAAHGGLDNPDERLVAWANECEAARRTRYPQSLADL